MRIFRVFLFIVHLALLFLIIGTILNAYIPPKVFAWFNLISLGFPMLIIGYILLTLFWIFSWKKRAFVFMFLGLFFMNPTKRWVNYTAEKKEMSDLKIVSFNIKGSKLGIDPIRNYIDAQDADIVFLQEDNMENYDLKNLKRADKTYLTSVYTKHKVISNKELFEGMYSEKFIAYCDQIDIEIKGQKIRLINTYLQPFKFEKSMVKLNGDGEEDERKVKNIVKRLIPTFKTHQEQIDIIKESIDQSPYPVILAGDFNAVPNSYEYYKMSENLKDAFVESGRGSGTSFHDYKYPLRIDYIFTSESIQALRYKVDYSVKLSDHYPVVASFKLR